MPIRFFPLALVALLASSATGLSAQQAPALPPDDELEQMLDHLDDPVNFLCFEGALAPLGAPDARDTEALRRTLTEYAQGGEPARLEGLERHVAQHPQSAWKPSLLVAMGLTYHYAGKTTQAINALEAAWANATRANADPLKGILDGGLRTLLDLHLGLGNDDRLQQLLQETEGRLLASQTQEGLRAVRQAHAQRQKSPHLADGGLWSVFQEARACLNPLDGEKALATVKNHLGTPKSLTDLHKLADTAKLGLCLAKRSPHATFPVSSLLYLRTGQFAIVTAAKKGCCHLLIPCLGKGWFTLETLQDEALALALVPRSALACGWQEASPMEGTPWLGKEWPKGGWQDKHPSSLATLAQRHRAAPWIAVYGGEKVNFTYPIPAETNQGKPQMPDTPAVLSYVQDDGDVVEWQAEIHYTMPRKADLGNIPLKASYPWTPGVRRKFPQGLKAFLVNGTQQIMGGTVTLLARYTRAGKTTQSTPRTITFQGENPQGTSVSQCLTLPDKNVTLGDTTVTLTGTNLTQWMRAIVRHESSDNFTQFCRKTKEPYWVKGFPLLNGQGDGGMGMMQITPKLDTEITEQQRMDYLWCWDKNMEKGISVFKEKPWSICKYHKDILKQKDYMETVQRTNQARKKQNQPEVQVNIPPFTATELLEDAVRGYNGFASPAKKHPWQFGLQLHEFRLKTREETDIGMVLELTNIHAAPGSNNQLADAVWTRVLVAERPVKPGDPNYVENVRAKLGNF